MLRVNVLGGLYLTDDGRPLSGPAAQPRRLAVLAMLAVAGDRGLTRDVFLARLWPDNDNEHGRHSLTQSLHALRRDLRCEQLFLGQKDIRLNPDFLGSDYAEFHKAFSTDAPEQAVALYQGPFLQGFHLNDADTFERWVEEQRAALAHDYGRALEASARRAAARQDHLAAVGYLRRRAAQEPSNPRVTVLLMEALAAGGDLVAALEYARTHERVMRDELDLPPDREVTAAAERVRRRARSSAAAGGDSAWAQGQAPEAPAPPAEMARPPLQRPTEPGQPPSRGEKGAIESEPAASLPPPAIAPPQREAGWSRGLRLSLLLAGALALLLVVRLDSRRPPALESRVVAIGPIQDYTHGRDPMGHPLADMLATNLARSAGFRVISYPRMLELMRQEKSTEDSAERVSAAARRAGAAELIDGVLYSLGARHYRLDVRRLDLASGELIGAYTVRGTDLFAMVDSGTARLVTDLGGVAPPGPLAAVSTTSLQAYQLYEDGLRRYSDGDITSAERLFKRALDEDPGFAQAAFYYGRSTSSGSRTETIDRFRRALELSRGASDRERLVIHAEWAAQNASPDLSALADTLMIRYPEEVDGYYYAAMGALQAGNFLAALGPFRKVIDLDSLGLASAHNRPCRVCDAYGGLSYVYYALDSTAEMNGIIRELVRRQPGAAASWRALAQLYMNGQQRDSAMYALQVADSLDPGNLISPRYLISVRSIGEEYPEAERLLRAEMEAGPVSYRNQARWDLAVVLRQMGRMREALAETRRFRLGIKERVRPGTAPYNALHEAQVLFDLGAYRASAALFDSIGQAQDTLDPAGQARDRVWAWVHEADAVAQLGDTARLRFLADTMQVLGRSVGTARERVLYAHVRGLLARVQGRDELAADWFLRSMISPVVGLTRTNYELAGIWLRQGRPRNAIHILGPAIRAGTVGPNLYITRTDLEERLAQAFEAAGQRDSALVYYHRVANAWSHADPEFLPRRRAVDAAINRLQRAPRRFGA